MTTENPTSAALADVREYIANKPTALEIEAQAIAEKYGYDTASLRFHRNRYQFGTLADTRVAPHYRALYSRALAIACERQAEVPAIAAE